MAGQSSREHSEERESRALVCCVSGRFPTEKPEPQLTIPLTKFANSVRMLAPFQETVHTESPRVCLESLRRAFHGTSLSLSRNVCRAFLG